MPNICFATIYVRGYKSCVDKFIEILQADYCYGDTIKINGIEYYDYNLEELTLRYNKRMDEYKFRDPESKGYCTAERHFYRVFEAYDNHEDCYGVMKFAIIDCEMAWSVSTCMLDDGYYRSRESKLHTSLIQESKRLKLDIEVWSCEEGMEFQEHYLYTNGIEVKNECEPYVTEFADQFDNYNNYLENTANSYKATEEEFNESLKYEIPLSLSDEIPLCMEQSAKPKYLGLLEMCKFTNK